MRILIAPDKFKGSMNAREAAAAIAEGVKRVYPAAEIIELPLSDGGEGLIGTLVCSRNGRFQEATVTGPLGKPVTARWGLIDEGKTAVIEMAEASGLVLVPEGLRNPYLTTTYGTGELIRAALDKKCSRLIIGIGGSATNDGGAGMARALGVIFKDKKGRELSEGGAALLELDQIDISHIDQRLKKTAITVASDVDNPLTGPEGASFVYGPQKGANPQAAELLDQALSRFAAVIKKDLGYDLAQVKGAGAAGGLGAGLIAFLGAELQPGLDLVLDQLQFNSLMPGCSLVITGEGKLDRQSLHGKVPIGVARRASKYKVPVLALTGALEADPSALHRKGITACFAIADGPLSIDESISRGQKLLKQKTEELMRLWKSAADSG